MRACSAQTLALVLSALALTSQAVPVAQDSQQGQSSDASGGTGGVVGQGDQQGQSTSSSTATASCRYQRQPWSGPPPTSPVQAGGPTSSWDLLVTIMGPAPPANIDAASSKPYQTVFQHHINQIHDYFPVSTGNNNILITFNMANDTSALQAAVNEAFPNLHVPCTNGQSQTASGRG